MSFYSLYCPSREDQPIIVPPISSHLSPRHHLGQRLALVRARLERRGAFGPVVSPLEGSHRAWLSPRICIPCARPQRGFEHSHPCDHVDWRERLVSIGTCYENCGMHKFSRLHTQEQGPQCYTQQCYTQQCYTQQCYFTQQYSTMLHSTIRYNGTLNASSRRRWGGSACDSAKRVHVGNQDSWRGAVARRRAQNEGVWVKYQSERTRGRSQHGFRKHQQPRLGRCKCALNS